MELMNERLSKSITCNPNSFLWIVLINNINTVDNAYGQRSYSLTSQARYLERNSVLNKFNFVSKSEKIS